MLQSMCQLVQRNFGDWILKRSMRKRIESHFGHTFTSTEIGLKNGRSSTWQMNVCFNRFSCHKFSFYTHWCDESINTWTREKKKKKKKIHSNCAMDDNRKDQSIINNFYGVISWKIKMRSCENYSLQTDQQQSGGLVNAIIRIGVLRPLTTLTNEQTINIYRWFWQYSIKITVVLLLMIACVQMRHLNTPFYSVPHIGLRMEISCDPKRNEKCIWENWLLWHKTNSLTLTLTHTTWFYY